MIANVSVMGKGRIPDRQTVWSFLPTSSQQEMRAAWGTFSWWVDHCLTLPTGPELERGPSCSAHGPKSGFQGRFPCPRG